MLPLRVICRLIGIPDTDVPKFVGWADASSAIFGFLVAEQADAATVALAKLERVRRRSARSATARSRSTTW